MSQDENDELRRLHELGASVAADVLCDIGEPERAAAPGLRPVNPSHRVTGRVRTAKFAPVDGEDGDARALGQLIDSTQPGDVLVLAAAAGGGTSCAVWGEVCSVAAESRGAAGVIIDGYLRDELAISGMSLPAIARGTVARDLRGVTMVSDVNVPVDVAGVRVSPGDLVVADVDGVVFVPADRVGDVIDQGEQQCRAEADMLAALRRGASFADLLAGEFIDDSPALQGGN